MIVSSLATALMLMLTAPAAEQSARPSAGVVRAEVRIRRVIVRVPVAAGATPLRMLPPVQWVERRADRCIPVQSLAAVSMARADSVDLIVAGGKRLRARLGEACPALDFYSGFYLRPSSDGMICATRDVIRSRSGEQCRIRAFRTLVPAR